MTIQVNCQCGQKLNAKPQWAGRRVKCPQCGKVLAVPKPANKQSTVDLNELLDEVGFTKSVVTESCPECHVEFSEDALICIHCGFHRELGKRVKVVRQVQPEEDMNLPPELRQALKNVRHEKIEKIAEAGQGYTSWLLGAVLFGCVGTFMIIAITMGGCQ